MKRVWCTRPLYLHLLILMYLWLLTCQSLHWMSVFFYILWILKSLSLTSFIHSDKIFLFQTQHQKKAVAKYTVKQLNYSNFVTLCVFKVKRLSANNMYSETVSFNKMHKTLAIYSKTIHLNMPEDSMHVYEIQSFCIL